MRSDVPLGVFLSGGIDSSVTAAIMADIADDPIQTYSIGFDVEEHDELEFARLVANEYDTDHYEYTLSADSMLDDLPDLLEHYQMPFGDTSALPTYHVARIASNDITVALTGDAGDENFAGYDRYTLERITSNVARIPKSLRTIGHATLSSIPEPYRDHRLVRRPKLALELAARDPASRYAYFVCHLIGEQADRVWDGPAPSDEFDHVRSAHNASDGPTQLDRVLDVDIHTYLPGSILTKVDRASMAHSLEVRSPFLDHEFVEFAARIPAKYKWHRGSQKWLLKKAFEDLLPNAIIERPKHGFGVPVQQWTRGELRPTVTESLERLGNRQPFDSYGLSSLLEEHLSKEEDYGYHIWDLFMLEKWFERYID